VTDHALDLYGIRPRRPSSEEERRRLFERLFAWGVVAIIHILMLFVVVADQRHRRDLAMRPPAETMLDLSRLAKGKAPPIRLIQPVVPRASAPEVTTAPVIVVPPPPNSQIAPPQTPADILKAIGEALSCGAENFENLTQTERNRCRRQPWLARRLPNGTIVLEAAAPQPFAPALVPKISGAEALRHEMQTAPPCPIMVSNVPCMNVTPQLSIPLN
jgi:hypothetical protein